MGRPKQTVEYFPHLLKDSTTIRALEMLYKNDGYAVWFKLLEVLGSSPDYKYIAKTKDQCDKLLDKFRVDGKLMTKILDTLCELNAIDKDMWKKNRTLYVPNLLNNIQKMKKKISSSTNLVEHEEKPKVNKDKYLEYVFLTKDEYKKLVERFGVEGTNARIENLDNYIGQKPNDSKRKYESHYRTILVWDNNEKKKNPTIQQKKPQYRDLSNYSFD